MRLPAKRNRQREAGGWDAAGIGGYIYPLTHREARPNPADGPRPIGPGSLRMTPALSLGIWGSVGVIMPFRFSLTTTP